MRLGVLPLGHAPLGVLDTEVLAPLRALNIDVIVPEPDTPPITTGVGAAQAAERLHRADCDGTLIFVGSDADEEEGDSAMYSAAICAAQAALHLAATPLFLSGLPSGTFFTAAGALAAIGVPFDRHFCTADFALSELTGVVQTWLSENRREERRRGTDAARHLYGHRLYIPGAYTTPDVAAWMHQFGVIVNRSAEGADFVADDGDALAALTGHLLARIAGADAKAMRTPVFGEQLGGADDETTRATFAQITTYAGRYRCTITRGNLGGDLPKGRASVLRYACDDGQLFAIATFPEFCAVLGEHVGALRAACYALDIEPVILL
jgi:hypothetical protein